MFWKIHAAPASIHSLKSPVAFPGDLEDEFDSPAASKDAAKLTLLGSIFADVIHANRTPSSHQRPRQRPRPLASSVPATSRAIFLHSVGEARTYRENA